MKPGVYIFLFGPSSGSSGGKIILKGTLTRRDKKKVEKGIFFPQWMYNGCVHIFPPMNHPPNCETWGFKSAKKADKFFGLRRGAPPFINGGFPKAPTPYHYLKLGGYLGQQQGLIMFLPKFKVLPSPLYFFRFISKC